MIHDLFCRYLAIYGSYEYRFYRIEKNSIQKQRIIANFCNIFTRRMFSEHILPIFWLRFGHILVICSLKLTIIKH